VAGHFDRDVDPSALGLLPDRLRRGHVRVRRVEDPVRAHLLREGRAERVHFGGEDSAGPEGPSDCDREEADRSAYRHEDRAPSEVLEIVLGKKGVDRVSEGLLDGGKRRVEVRVVLPRVQLGEDSEFGEHAITVDPEDLHVLADVHLARTTLVAGPVHDVGLGRNVVADLKAPNALADLDHFPAEFMTGDHRDVANARLGPFVPDPDVNIRSADRGRAYAHEDFVVGRFRFGDGADLGAGAPLGLYERLHALPLRFAEGLGRLTVGEFWASTTHPCEPGSLYARVRDRASRRVGFRGETRVSDGPGPSRARALI